MSEQTRQILTMLSEGKISVDEAERLLGALRAGEGGTPDEKTDREGRRGTKPKYLRVIVDGEGRKVNVRVPIQLIRAGMRFGALIPKKARADIEKHFSQQGMDLDLKNIKPEDIDALLDELAELTVEVEEDGERRVHVFCE